MKQYPRQRPTSVTFISTILLIRVGFGLLLLLPILFPRDPMTQNLPVNMNAVWLTFVPIIIFATCGFFMLRGANWARLLLFIAVPVLYIIIGILIYSNVSAFSRIKMASLPLFVVFHLATFAVVGAILVSRSANRFFIGRDKIIRKEQSRRSGSRNDKMGRRSFDY